MKLTSDMEKTKAPEKESEWFSEFTNVKATDTVIAVFTIVIGIYTVCLTKATRNPATISGKQEESTRIIERAYVKMSHIGNGLTLRENRGTEWYEVRIKIENFGKTPAWVTDVRLSWMNQGCDKPFPITIEYRDSDAAHRATSAFLVPGEAFFIDRKSPGTHGAAIKKLMLFG